MKINETTNNNQNFNARLCGDYKTVINIVKDAKIPDSTIKSYLEEFNKLVPNDNDRIFLFFRKLGNDYYESSLIRSQVEILREKDPFDLLKLRDQVYPFKQKPKNLLQLMVNAVDKIVNNKTEIANIQPKEVKQPFLSFLFGKTQENTIRSKQTINTNIPRFFYEKKSGWDDKIFSKLESQKTTNFDDKGILIKDLLG